MSKPVKELLRKELIRRLEGVASLAVVGFTGLDAVATNEIRARLREKDIEMMVVKNAVAREAFDAVGLTATTSLLDGPCALAHGSDSVVGVVRELLELGREAPNLVLKGAVLEGEAFGPDRIEELSKFPTHAEALGWVVSCAVSGGGNLVVCLLAPGGRLAGAVKTIGV